MAGGQPISEAVADAAAGWLTLMMSGEATDDDMRRLREWRGAHADHERAWAHIEAVSGRLKVMERQAAYKALSPYADLKSPTRRRTLNLLVLGGVIGFTGVMATRKRTWQAAVADYRTAAGEQRAVALSDGSHILLDTASAIDVRFDAQRRLVRLIAGSVLIVTGHRMVRGSADQRPFLVETGEGHIRALGTRFTVRQDDSSTSVVVLDSAVEIRPLDSPGFARVLHAGHRATFTRHTIEPDAPISDSDSAWTRGQIVADNMPLAEFLAVLGSYRPGIVQCDPSVAGLRFSGVFPVDDTDRILETLPTVLPVLVRRRTRYWVTVEARPSSAGF
jgi:transmembrane sensor